MRLTNDYKNFASNVDKHIEPQSYHEASKDPKWVSTMQDEISSLEVNKTWCIIPLPKDKTHIGCR